MKTVNFRQVCLSGHGTLVGEGVALWARAGTEAGAGTTAGRSADTEAGAPEVAWDPGQCARPAWDTG